MMIPLLKQIYKYRKYYSEWLKHRQRIVHEAFFVTLCKKENEGFNNSDNMHLHHFQYPSALYYTICHSSAFVLGRSQLCHCESKEPIWTLVFAFVTNESFFIISLDA